MSVVEMRMFVDGERRA